MSQATKIQFIHELNVASRGLFVEMAIASAVEKGSAQGGETIEKLVRATVCCIVVKQKVFGC